MHFSSESWQLLTGADPEGTARGARVGWEEGKAEGIDARGAKGANPKTPSGWGKGKGFLSQTDYRVWERRKLPSGIRGGALAANGFQCFPSVTECISLRCLKLTSCRKTFIDGDRRTVKILLASQ